jgi:hypothetical protein
LPGIYSHDPGESILVTAVPDPKYAFLEWSGDLESSLNPETVSMDSNKSILANFIEVSVLPPVNFKGRKIENLSLVQVEYVIHLTWEANPQNEGILQYKIYNIAGAEQTLLAELDYGIFEYTKRRVSKDKEYTYAITAVNGDLEESFPATVVVI